MHSNFDRNGYTLFNDFQTEGEFDDYSVEEERNGNSELINYDQSIFDKV